MTINALKIILFFSRSPKILYYFSYDYSKIYLNIGLRPTTVVFTTRPMNTITINNNGIMND